MSDDRPENRVRRGRNVAVFAILAAFAVLVFAVTIVKLGAIGAPG